MDAIKGWVMAICFAAVAAGMAGILAPSGNLEKIYKFVISLFFLACVLTPVFHLRNIDISRFSSQPELSVSEDGSARQTVAQQEAELVKENLSNLVVNTCKTYGVTPLAVYIDLSQSGSGYRIGGCRVILAQGDMGKKDALTAAVKSGLGIDATIEEKEEVMRQGTSEFGGAAESRES